MRQYYPYAFKRKSFRRFNSELALSSEEIEDVESFLLTRMIKLNPEVLVATQVVLTAETTCKRGSHCVLIYSEHTGQGLLNVGYALQQLDLYLASKDIGACWYGMGKVPSTIYNGLPFTVMIAIGKANPDEFRKDYKKATRKMLEEIWTGEPLGDMGPYVKLAPSTCNAQPWHFSYVDGILEVRMQCKEKMIVPKDKIEFYNAIDMGIILLFIDIWLDENSVVYKRELLISDGVLKNGDVVARYEVIHNLNSFESEFSVYGSLIFL